jgi:hypothetical protein
MASEFTAAKFLQNFLAGTFLARGTFNQSLAVAQTEGPHDEMSRAGLRFYLFGGAATGQAPVQAVPTTTAAHLLYNGNPAGGASFFLDWASLVANSGTVGAGGYLYMCLCGAGNVPTTRPAALASTLITNANTGSSNKSGAIYATAQTLIGAIAANWIPVAQLGPVFDTVASQTAIGPATFEGSVIVAPGCAVAFQAISPTGTTPLFTLAASWREVQTTFG